MNKAQSGWTDDRLEKWLNTLREKNMDGGKPSYMGDEGKKIGKVRRKGY